MANKFKYSIPKRSEEILSNLFFEIINYENYGMYHYVTWSNEKMNFSFGYERGYFDCQISPNKNFRKSFQIIKLLRYLLNDKKFYEKRLIEVKRFHTLSREEYVDILFNHYSIIEKFCTSYNEGLNEKIEKFWKKG